MESNLQEVSQHIASLRSMAVDMGNEISQQNRQLDDINRKVFIFILLVLDVWSFID